MRETQKRPPGAVAEPIDFLGQPIDLQQVFFARRKQAGTRQDLRGAVVLDVTDHQVADVQLRIGDAPLFKAIRSIEHVNGPLAVQNFKLAIALDIAHPQNFKAV